MAVRKRFIAGMRCPACQTQDSLAIWCESNADVIGCIKCGHQAREADKEAREHIRKEEQVVGVFHPN